MKQKNEDVEKIIAKMDMKGLAEAFAKGDLEWHEKEWKEFIENVRKQGFSAGQENMREKMMKCVPEEREYDKEIEDSGGQDFLMRGFNYCRTQMIQNIKEII